MGSTVQTNVVAKEFIDETLYDLMHRNAYEYLVDCKVDPANTIEGNTTTQMPFYLRIHKDFGDYIKKKVVALGQNSPRHRRKGVDNESSGLRLRSGQMPLEDVVLKPEETLLCNQLTMWAMRDPSMPLYELRDRQPRAARAVPKRDDFIQQLEQYADRFMQLVEESLWERIGRSSVHVHRNARREGLFEVFVHHWSAQYGRLDERFDARITLAWTMVAIKNPFCQRRFGLEGL